MTSRDGDERIRGALARVWPDPATVDDVVTRRLGGGVNSRSYLVTADERRCVLRLPVEAAPALLDFASEVRAMRAAAAAGLAPAVVGYDVAARVLLTEYRGEPWTPAAARTELGIRRLADLLRRLHGVAVELPAFDAAGIARGYLEALGGQRSLTARERVFHTEVLTLAEWFSRYEPAAFCHNDLVAANVLDEGTRLLLVDFEYAVRSSPLLDLANVAAMNGHTALERGALLAAYCEGGTFAVTPAELDDAVRMERLLAYFWARVGARRAAGKHVYEELAARLLATL